MKLNESHSLNPKQLLLFVASYSGASLPSSLPLPSFLDWSTEALPPFYNITHLAYPAYHLVV